MSCALLETVDSYTVHFKIQEEEVEVLISCHLSFLYHFFLQEDETDHSAIHSVDQAKQSFAEWLAIAQSAIHTARVIAENRAYRAEHELHKLPT